MRRLGRELPGRVCAALALGAALSVVPGPARADDLDDVLGGFEDDDLGVAEPAEAPAREEPRWWDLTGSASLGASVNYLEHEAGDGKDYTGLSRLRSRLNLQLDLDLPRDWKLRLAGFGYYDWAYLANDRGRYTDEVLRDYEWEADFQEVWLQGSLFPGFDLKAGRQVVNWGRSDNLRVLDVLNPLDNREPGLADIEDLRRPVTMLRADYSAGPFIFTGVAVPEIRFNQNPVFGNDFAPDVSSGAFALPMAPGPGPAPMLPPVTFGTIEEHTPSESLENTEWAARITGIFPGWDASLQFASYWDDLPHLESDFRGFDFAGAFQQILMGRVPDLPIELDHSRLRLVGAGGNYTTGSWLLKTEVAWIDGFEYPVAEPVPVPGLGAAVLPVGVIQTGRVDAMVGVEYYGINDHTIAVEIAHRHILDFDRRMTAFDVDENSLEGALRITGSYLRERLEATFVALGFGVRLENGAIVRFQTSYDLRDALVLTVGVLLFKEGDPVGLSTVGRNDRVFAELKWSF